MNKISSSKSNDASGKRFGQLLNRIEQNYSRLSDQLDELEVLVPETLENVLRSSSPHKPK